MLPLYFKNKAKRLSPVLYDVFVRNIKYRKATGIVMPCHYRGLFIRSDGVLFPCCDVCNVEALRIAHIDDDALFEKIKSYDKVCSCDHYKLRVGYENEAPKYRLLNIEVSLVCQAICAMCCVNAPDSKGKYDYYSSLMKVVKKIKPEIVLLQGGEVLIQEKTYRWVDQLKDESPDVKVYALTNGNISCDKIENVEKGYERLYVSFVGFQPETYRAIMGISIDKTISFVERLIERGKVQVYLKYLVTPVNAHEAELFFSWAINIKARRINFDGAVNEKYIVRGTSDNYWSKIYKRSAVKLKLSIISNKKVMKRVGMVVLFTPEIMRLFDITKEFIESNDLVGIIVDRSRSRLFCAGECENYHNWPED